MRWEFCNSRFPCSSEYLIQISIHLMELEHNKQACEWWYDLWNAIALAGSWSAKRGIPTPPDVINLTMTTLLVYRDAAGSKEPVCCSWYICSRGPDIPKQYHLKGRDTWNGTGYQLLHSTVLLGNSTSEALPMVWYKVLYLARITFQAGEHAQEITLFFSCASARIFESMICATGRGPSFKPSINADY